MAVLAAVGEGRGAEDGGAVAAAVADAGPGDAVGGGEAQAHPQFLRGGVALFAEGFGEGFGGGAAKVVELRVEVSGQGAHLEADGGRKERLLLVSARS